MTPDPIVNRVIEQYVERSKRGVAKYGTTLAENRAALRARVRHLLEELMDASLYAQWIIEKLDNEAYDPDADIDGV